MAKRLVLCCDGTNNELAGHSSNVLRLYRMLERDSGQVTWYDAGVGTIAEPDRITGFGRRVSRRLDSAMGLTIRQHFINAYRFLVRHYEPGDRIYLTGFSRGAYTARAVAGAIHMLGIVRPELEDLSELAWAIYSGENEHAGKLFEAAARFRKSFSVSDSRDTPRIHCVAVWDTVSAFGLVSDMRTLPHTSDNQSVAHIRHALAIDERRGMFQPNRFRPKDRLQHDSIKEVWFAGVHSDVGGGYAEKDQKTDSGQSVQGSTLSKVSLEWMMRELSELGLTFDETIVKDLMDSRQHPPADPMGATHESLKGTWHMLELVPQRRFSQQKADVAWHAPNRWRSRRIRSEYDDEKNLIGPAIHTSVQQRMDNTQLAYKPPNLPEQYLVEE